MGKHDRYQRPAQAAPPISFVPDPASVTERPKLAALPELDLPIVAMLDGKEVRAKNYAGGCLVCIDGHLSHLPPGTIIKNGKFIKG